MAGLKIKKGDLVQVIAGKGFVRGGDSARGRVLEVLPQKRKVIVEGVNQITRHEKVRMNRKGGQEGGISHKEAPIDVSNVALVCPNDGPVRAAYRLEPGTDAKLRICKKCGAEL